MNKHASKNNGTVAVIDPRKPIDLEKIGSDQIRHSGEFDTAALGRQARAMIDHVEGLKSERAKKAIVAGIYLLQVKAALGHGDFGPWKKKHFGDARSRSANNFTALAGKFCRSAKLLMPEIIAANQMALTLATKSGEGKQFVTKLDKFVGTKGLTELMQIHGVIKRGGAREEAQSAITNGSDDKTTATTNPKPPASRSPEAEAYQQMVDSITNAEGVLFDEVRWSLITPTAAAQLEPLLKRLQSRFHERLLKARHES